jgi:hypothetical protein
MEGEWNKVEKTPDTPAAILGGDVYEALKAIATKELNTDRLNSNKIFKNQNEGCVISFWNIDGEELTSTQWMILKATAEKIFFGLKLMYSDRPEFESLVCKFDVTDSGRGQIIIKQNVQ